MVKKVVCIVQARYTSTRLPGKVFLNLAGKPVIEQIFNQLSYSKRINQSVLATSELSSDDKLEVWAKSKNIEYYRGSLDDVLDRFYFTAKSFNADIVVRITGDCPLIDPEVVDDVISLFLKDNYDYTSNINPPTFPDGLDTEVFKFSVLEETWKNAKLKSEREHVTPYVRKHNEKFKIGNFENKINLSHYRWTLDNEEDHELISRIYEKLYKENNYIKMEEVLELIKNNINLQNINSHIRRNEGYDKSIKNDKLTINKN